MYRGSPGILQVAGRARGRLESWQKWSFPCGPPGQGGAAPAGWVPVHKRISRFSLAAGQIGIRMTGPGAEPACMAELTEVHTRGQAWWTLGFEATGPTSLLRREIETTVALVLDQDLPDDMKLDTGHSQSYAEWLGWQPDSEPTPEQCLKPVDEAGEGVPSRLPSQVSSKAGAGNAGREGTPVLTVVQEGSSGEEPGRPGSLIDEIVREGARRMLAEALRAEVDAYITAFAGERDEDGRAPGGAQRLPPAAGRC